MPNPSSDSPYCRTYPHEPPSRSPVALWLCALAVAAPLGHLLPVLGERPTTGRVEDRYITPVPSVAFLGTVGLLWVTLRGAVGPLSAVFCGALLAVGGVSYAVGAGWRTAPVSALWLAAAGLLPLVAATGNLMLAVAVEGRSGATAALAADAAVVAVVSLALVVAYCWLAHRTVSEAAFTALGSDRVRGAFLGGYLAVVAGLCFAVVRFSAAVVTTAGPLVASLLLLPLAVPVGGWLYHALETAVARASLYRNAERRSVDGVRLYVLDAEAAVVRALPVPRGVVLGRPVAETLSDSELAAVVAHERHHLRPRRRILSVVGTLLSVPVGRNALLSFLDHPAGERAADSHAAESESVETLAAALRKLEGLGGRPRPDPNPLVAPYALLYGPAFDRAVHRSVDDRIEAVTAGASDR